MIIRVNPQRIGEALKVICIGLGIATILIGGAVFLHGMIVEHDGEEVINSYHVVLQFVLLVCFIFSALGALFLVAGIIGSIIQTVHEWCEGTRPFEIALGKDRKLKSIKEELNS